MRVRSVTKVLSWRGLGFSLGGLQTWLTRMKPRSFGGNSKTLLVTRQLEYFATLLPQAKPVKWEEINRWIIKRLKWHLLIDDDDDWLIFKFSICRTAALFFHNLETWGFVQEAGLLRYQDYICWEKHKSLQNWNMACCRLTACERHLQCVEFLGFPTQKVKTICQ